MPNMLIRIPAGTYPGTYRQKLIAAFNSAAATVERIPDNPRMRFVCWLQIEETAPGDWSCGAVDVSQQMLTCVAQIHLPRGVLDDGAKARYLGLLHAAFEQALPPDEQRPLSTSIQLFEVADGAWGANGKVVRLPDLARISGYEHLQHLVVGP